MRWRRLVENHWGWVFAAAAIASVAARLVLSFAYYGQPYDQDSFAAVRDAVVGDPFGVYSATGEFRWPYPPLYFLWIAAADAIQGATDLAFHGLVNCPAIAADVAIAWLAQAFLAARGADALARAAAAALVLLGPVFLAISGYHGQIDSVAILPAVAALYVWEEGGARRAVWAGLLIGAGIAVKSFPAVMLLALLPTARSGREGVVLVGAAGAVPLLLLAPYLAGDALAVRRALDYPSLGTAGGLGLISTTISNPVTDFVRDHASAWNAAVLAGLALFMWRVRPRAPRAAVIAWLTLLVLGSGFYLNYLVWALPFLVMDGMLLAAAAVQAVALPPMVVTYAGLFGTWVAARAFDVPMLLLWAAFCLGLAHLVRQAISDRPPVGGRLAAEPP